MAQAPIEKSHHRENLALWAQVAIGVGLVIAGIVITINEFSDGADVERGGGMYVLMFGPIVAGTILAIRAALHLAGFKGFVAMRYLLVAQPKVTRRTKIAILAGIGVRIALSILVIDSRLTPTNPIAWMEWAAIAFVGAVIFWGVLRHSKPAFIIFIFGCFVGLVCGIGNLLVVHDKLPFIALDADQSTRMQQVLGITMLCGFFLAGLATFFGFLRAFFTFFTTVPIGGVWIGTMALVMVLAVMSGFETDLRDKILGSNAHIQITREDGKDFTEWREVKAKIDKIPGVVASTPYAVSEVVIAANNNGMPVIIKGIDPDTVGAVTDLVSDLDDREAMARLEPLVVEQRDRTVKQNPRPTATKSSDALPDDMVTGGDPIDFSGSSPSSGTGSGSGSGSASPGAGSGSSAPAPKKAPASGSGAQAPSSGDTATGSGSAVAAGDPKPTIRDTTTDRPGPMMQLNDDGTVRDSHGRIVGAAVPGVATITKGSSDTEGPPEDEFGGDARDIQDFDYDKLPGTIRWATGEHEGVPPDLNLGHRADTSMRVSDESSSTRRTLALHGVLVGRELVKQTHLYTGQEVRVVSPLSDPSNPDATGTPIPFNRDYRVAGIFYTGMYEYDLKYVYVTLDSLQTFLDRGDAVDGIEVRITDADDTGRYVPTDVSPGLIREALGPGYRVVDWRELNRSLFSALKLEKIAMFLVLGIVILVASFSIVGNLIMVVVEKAREIALLKTLGASDFGVMQLFAIQGLLIGLIGTLLGITFGLLGCWAGKRFGLPLNPDVYYIDRLPIHVDPTSVMAAGAAGVLISIAATLYPALLAARVRPAAGMRH